MVFQHATLFDSMTLAENVALPLRKHQRLRRRAPRSTRRARRLEQVHMGELRRPLPGRARRRHAQARRDRARARARPEFVLFDEPTTGLDPVSARRIDKLIRELAAAARRHRDRRVARSAVDLRHRRSRRVALPRRRARRRARRPSCAPRPIRSSSSSSPASRRARWRRRGSRSGYVY